MELKREERLWDRTRKNRQQEAEDFINEYLEASQHIDEDTKEAVRVSTRNLIKLSNKVEDKVCSKTKFEKRTPRTHC